MHAHLNIRANGKDMTLPADFELDMQEQNPLFHDNEMSTYPAEVPFDGNRFMLGNMDDKSSDLRPVDVEHTKMEIYLEGMPYRSGMLSVEDGAEMEDSFSMSIQAQEQSLTDMIGELTCQDLKQARKLLVGHCIGNVKVHYEYGLKVSVHYDSKKTDTVAHSLNKRSKTEQLELQALGFSVPTDPIYANKFALETEGMYINTSAPYGQQDNAGRPAAYCNARVCFTDFKADSDGNTSESKVLTDTYSPYRVLDADRMQSGICFYVLYMLECLFHTLGIRCDMSEIMGIEDLKRLCFFTTHHKFDMERADGLDNPDRYDFNSLAEINNWLNSHRTAKYPLGQLECDYEKARKVDSVSFDGSTYVVGENDIDEIKYEPENVIFDVKAREMKMYANSENFPDESVQSVLDSLWAAFGIKFVMDYENQTVSARLIRNVLRDQRPPIKLHGKVNRITPVAEKITGVWQHYEAESDDKEKAKNIRDGVRDYDTNFDYEDYDKVDDTLSYAQIIHKRSASDTTCYIDKRTGNRYRIKVNGEAETADQLEPVIFEVGQYSGVKIGDCSKKNEDFIEELSIGFTPVIFNDVNAKNELAATETWSATFNVNGHVVTADVQTIGSCQNVLAAFIDEDFEHKDKETKIKNVYGDDYSYMYLNEKFTCPEAYNPGDTDDCNSPLQSQDWGFAVCVMRGGGSNATINYTDYNFDGFGNRKWTTTVGTYMMDSDSISHWGDVYDYNGNIEGIGDDKDRFSLKLRAYATDPKTGKPWCNKDVMNRGIFDTFMREYAYWLLHRKALVLECEMEVAEVVDIKNHWDRRFEMDGMVFMIDKVNTKMSVANGLDKVELRVYTV